MRQAGTLSNARDATRFTAWLLAQRIDAHAEEQDSVWAIWVREEDHLAQAREALAHFREHSDDPKYQGAEKTAEAVLRDEEAKRRQAQGNVVEMRKHWGSASAAFGGGVPRRCPLVLAMAGICVLVMILGGSKDGNLLSSLF